MQATLTIEDDDSKRVKHNQCSLHYLIPFLSGVTISVETPTYIVNEEDSSVEVCAILISGALERTVRFTLATTDGSATSPADFSSTSIDLEFNSTTIRACADIPIVDDSKVELAENLTVVISGENPDIVFEPDTAVVTITDNDRVVIGFEMETYEGDEGQAVEVCAIVRNGTLERSVLVDIFTGDLTAEGITKKIAASV